MDIIDLGQMLTRMIIIAIEVHLTVTDMATIHLTIAVTHILQIGIRRLTMMMTIIQGITTTIPTTTTIGKRRLVI